MFLLLHFPIGAVKPKAVVLNQGNFASLGHQKTFGDATTGGQGRSYWQLEVRNAAKHPAVHSTVFTSKNYYPTQYGTTAKDEEF